jgi:hypothetical protein
MVCYFRIWLSVRKLCLGQKNREQRQTGIWGKEQDKVQGERHSSCSWSSSQCLKYQIHIPCWSIQASALTTPLKPLDTDAPVVISWLLPSVSYPSSPMLLLQSLPITHRVDCCSPVFSLWLLSWVTLYPAYKDCLVADMGPTMAICLVWRDKDF